MRRALNFLLAYVAAVALLVPPSFAQVSVDIGKTGKGRAVTVQCSSSVAATVTGTVAETTLATCNIPANAIGPNGGVNVISLWSYTNSANTKTLRHKLGATAWRASAVTTTSVTNVWDLFRNRGSASSQLVMLGLGSAAGVIQVPMTENTAAPIALTLTCQLALATESCTLESYEVWLLP